MKGFDIEIKNNLLDPKHVQNMGQAVWLYMWLVDKMTSITEEGIGKVLGGKPIKYEEVEVELGMSRNTYTRWIAKLLKYPYIETTLAPQGIVFRVLKAHKHFSKKQSAKTNKYYENFDWKKEQHEKMSADRIRTAPRGENHYNWKNGITPINLSIRNSAQYRNWRQEVFERDLYSCRSCGEKGGKLEAHHIKSFAEYPEHRFVVGNGLTLCVNCHKDVTYGRFTINENSFPKSGEPVGGVLHQKSGTQYKTSSRRDNNKDIELKPFSKEEALKRLSIRPK